jgi:hypothetical protein
MASAARRALHAERCTPSAARRALHAERCTPSAATAAAGSNARRLELRRRESARRVANYFCFYLLQTGAGLLL